MTEKIVLKGRVSWCRGEGEALVTQQSFQFVTDINKETGEVVNPRSDIYGENVIGKVLVFRGTRSGAGMHSQITETERLSGGKPAACISAWPISYMWVVGCYQAKIPIIDRLDRNPYEVIETGDWVVVDGGNGIVTVTKKK